MSIYKYSNSGVSNANTTPVFKAWLDECKAAGNTFLSDLTIAMTGSGSTAVLTISDDSSNVFTFKHIESETNPAQSQNAGYISYSNGTVTMYKKEGGYDGYNRLYIVGAILCNGGLIISIAANYAAATSAPTAAANNAIGMFMLVKDSNGKLSAIIRNITISNRSITDSTNLAITCGNSSTITTLNISPTYNSQKTALVPIVVTTSLGDTTIPVFYTSIQTEMSALGLQGVSMESNNYITNGYCFIKDDVSN